METKDDLYEFHAIYLQYCIIPLFSPELLFLFFNFLGGVSRQPLRQHKANMSPVGSQWKPLLHKCVKSALYLTLGKAEEVK